MEPPTRRNLSLKSTPGQEWPGIKHQARHDGFLDRGPGMSGSANFTVRSDPSLPDRQSGKYQVRNDKRKGDCDEDAAPDGVAS